MARERDQTGITEIRTATGSIRLPKGPRPRDLWDRALEMPFLWLALFLVLGAWCLLPGAFLFTHRVEPGTIAERDYIASRDLLLLDRNATQAKQQKERDAVLPLYDFDPGAFQDSDRKLADLFGLGRRLLARVSVDSDGGRVEMRQSDRAAVLEELASPAPDRLRTTQEQLVLLLRRDFSRDLEDRLRSLMGQALRRGVVANKDQLLENQLRGVTLRDLGSGQERTQANLFAHLGYPDEVRDFFESEVRGWSGYSADERRLLVALLTDNLTPNLLLNLSETQVRQEAAATGVSQVFNQIRKGQVIVRKGDPISEPQARVIAQMRGERQLRHQLGPMAAILALLGLVAATLWLAGQRERVADHSQARVLSESLLLLLISLLATKFCFLVANALSGAFEASALTSARSWAYAIPFASVAMLATLLLGRNAALMLSVLFSVLCSRLVLDGDGLWVVFYGLAGSLGAISALERYQFRHRLVMARVGLIVGGINLLMVLILTALGPAERDAMQVAFDALCALAGGLLVTAVGSFALPILEWMLGITTDIKLVELSNTNLPLLRDLAFKAPGTFQHSLMVANLAKEGCEAIRADPVLAYTAGLYHDVGKMERPDYFIENQRPGHNRHDKLLPSMSALILINHVKEGVDLARQDNLPQVIQDAIQQHHGTRLMKFFYSRAQEQREPGAEDITEERYRYPGPKPQNKVMGVLMLADAVEAASRTLTEPTPAKVRGLIRTIFEDCLQDGQLDHTDLTLTDLRNVGESFHRVLSNIFHQRIDYPGFDFNAGPKREKRAIRQAS